VLKEFEARVAEYAGVAHCVAVGNGTLALQLAIHAAGFHSDVIVPSLTFVATAHALAWQGIRPVFADVDPHTWTLDPHSVERAWTPATSGIMGVHLWGQVCDTESLERTAKRYDVPLLYDASHALGCRRGGTPIGNFGLAETVSFHATKFVNAAEGGAVLTNDSALAQQLRELRNFGFAGPGDVVRVGVNAKMSEISAAIGLTSLEFAPEIVAVNRTNDATYRLAIDRLPGLSTKSFNDGEPTNYQYVVMEVDSRQTGLTRDDIVAVLRAENVYARRYFYPGCHQLPTYRHLPHIELPHTEAILARVVTLPTGLAVDQTDILQIGCILELALSDPPRVQRALSSGHEAVGAVARNPHVTC
jgi:dTDP-4-amino-4,6-dideoxygalactose transaminase